MVDEFDLPSDKTAGELGSDAVWFALHTILAVVLLALVVVGIGLTQPDADAVPPKLLGTILVFFIPMIGGFLIAKVRQDEIAKHTWISGLLLFSVVCVWVLDLPTGNGLCENCLALEKLYRTFFDIAHGSGLMGGDGLLIGTWMPLSMIGYSVGARFGLNVR